MKRIERRPDGLARPTQLHLCPAPAAAVAGPGAILRLRPGRPAGRCGVRYRLAGRGPGRATLLRWGAPGGVLGAGNHPLEGGERWKVAGNERSTTDGRIGRPGTWPCGLIMMRRPTGSGAGSVPETRTPGKPRKSGGTFSRTGTPDMADLNADAEMDSVNWLELAEAWTEE